MTRAVFLLTLLAGCPKPPPVRPMPVADVEPTPWCIRLRVASLGAVTACAETEAKCMRGRAEIRKVGGWGGVTAASECEYAP